MTLKNASKVLPLGCYFVFITGSFIFDFEPGRQIGQNFISFAADMFKILPCAFILIGLFEVWVKKESVEKHLGTNSNPLAYLWVILLAGTTIGGLYVAFPVAHSLYKKGAKLAVIFTFVGAAAVCRIPMTIFEASFMGVKFTMTRLAVSIPLIIASSIGLGNYLEKRNFSLSQGGSA